jgi:hypothetical protein
MCKQQIYDPKTHKFRKCRRKNTRGQSYCYQHIDQDLDLVNRCCFCGTECNPASQTCGRCPREIGGWILGYKKKPAFF